jgi:hypothetical protein
MPKMEVRNTSSVLTSLRSGSIVLVRMPYAATSWTASASVSLCRQHAGWSLSHVFDTLYGPPWKCSHYRSIFLPAPSCPPGPSARTVPVGGSIPTLRLLTLCRACSARTPCRRSPLRTRSSTPICIRILPAMLSLFKLTRRHPSFGLSTKPPQILH